MHSCNQSQKTNFDFGNWKLQLTHLCLYFSKVSFIIEIGSVFFKKSRENESCIFGLVRSFSLPNFLEYFETLKYFNFLSWNYFTQQEFTGNVHELLLVRVMLYV